jgi:two-component system chemotaxis response regulator CheB
LFEIVVIAASMGGPEAVRKVLRGLPAEFPAAVVVVQHRAPSANHVTLELLRRQTCLPVRLADQGDRPQPGIVDVAPADRQLILAASGMYQIAKSKSPFGCAADPLFSTVAVYFGQRAIGVVLSGMQDDGAAGISALKARGGWALAQNRATARCFGMPSAAIATGCVDYVLPVTRISHALVALTMWPGATELFRVPSPFWAEAVA